MWYKIKRILVGTQQVRPSETVQTFDFQNDWNLWWVWFTKRWTPSYVSWQWWTIGTNSNDAYASWITPPSSIYKGTLRQVKIWFTKNNVQTSSTGQGAWICSSDLSIYCHYSHPRSEWPAILYYTNWNTYFTDTANIYWDIYISYILNDDNSMVVDINWTTYNIWNYASVFRWLWTNKNLCLDICRWGTDAPYIRKVQIKTL